MKSRIFIVEDHPIMRQTYTVLFGSSGEFEVCGTASSAEEALRLIPAASPDLILADISLPGMSGLQFVKELREASNGIRVLVTSGHDGVHYANEAERAGADGFVTKGDFQELLREIRQLLKS